MPISLANIPSQFTFDGTSSSWSHPNSNEAIGTKLHTRYDNYAVVACVKLCCNLSDSQTLNCNEMKFPPNCMWKIGGETVSVGPRLILLGTTWWRHQKETFSALLPLCAVNSPSQRPVTQRFDVFFDRVNKRLSKQSLGWWFETPSRSLWRHCNEHDVFRVVYNRSFFSSCDFWRHFKVQHS